MEPLFGSEYRTQRQARTEHPTEHSKPSVSVEPNTDPNRVQPNTPHAHEPNSSKSCPSTSTRTNARYAAVGGLTANATPTKPMRYGRRTRHDRPLRLHPHLSRMRKAKPRALVRQLRRPRRSRCIPTRQGVERVHQVRITQWPALQRMPAEEAMTRLLPPLTTPCPDCGHPMTVPMELCLACTERRRLRHLEWRACNQCGGIGHRTTACTRTSEGITR